MLRNMHLESVHRQVRSDLLADSYRQPPVASPDEPVQVKTTDPLIRGLLKAVRHLRHVCAAGPRNLPTLKH
jgi:hypothetical protein